MKLVDMEHLRGGGQVGQQEKGGGSRSQNVRTGGGKECDGWIASRCEMLMSFFPALFLHSTWRPAYF